MNMALQSLIIMVVINTVYEKIEENQLQKLAANRLGYHDHASFNDIYSLKQADRNSDAL